MQNKTLCSYPWISSAVRPKGQVIPCCRYANEYPGHEDSMVYSSDPRNTQHWVELRKKMLAGEKTEYCDKCYKEDESGIESMRQGSLKNFIPIKNEVVPLRHLEVSFNNLCNLACVHCSSYFSSTWYSEDYKKGKIGKIGVLQHEISFDNWDLSQLTDLKIIGGEPLMEQKKFIELMRKLNLPKMFLQICTNGTHMPNEELRFQIERCKSVYLEVSLDGIGTVNDWYRWPSKFEKILENLKTYEEWFGNHKKIRKIIHCVINAVNVMYLPDIINYVNTNLPSWDITWDWIQGPDWQQVCVLPSGVKQQLILDFSNLDKTYNINTDQIPNPYAVTIDRLKDTPKVTWDEFKSKTIELSDDRKLNFLEMVPKFKNIWENVE